MGIQLSDLLSRKHCGKKRNCSLRAISPFPTMFSKAFLFPRVVKSWDHFVKGSVEMICVFDAYRKNVEMFVLH